MTNSVKISKDDVSGKIWIALTEDKFVDCDFVIVEVVKGFKYQK